MNTAIYGLLAIAGVSILIAMLSTKKFFKVLFITAFQGVAALFAVDFIARLIGVQISVNPQTLILSCIGGVPAVTFLLICGIFFR